MKKTHYLFNTLKERGGSHESAKLYTATTINTGETEIVIEKTITERYPIQEYEKVVDLYARLNCGDGRRLYKLEELAHPYNPNPEE